MNLIGIMRARNEDWVIGASLRAALKWCDEVVVLNHCSTDTTADKVIDVAEEFSGRITLIHEENPVWSEMHHLQRLLDAARRREATHIAITDCDEILTANLLPVIRGYIEALPKAGSLQVGMPCVWRNLNQYRIGRSVWANRFDLHLAFQDHESLTWYPKDGYDHHHRAPFNVRSANQIQTDGGVMHLQFANWRRLTAKHALYKMMERVKYPEKSVTKIDYEYSLALDESNLVTKEIPALWWEGHRGLQRHVDLTAEPWQERECRRLLHQFGPMPFTALNLFGVVDQPTTL